MEMLGSVVNIFLYYYYTVGKFFAGKPAAAGESAGGKEHSRRTAEEGDCSKGSYDVWM